MENKIIKTINEELLKITMLAQNEWHNIKVTNLNYNLNEVEKDTANELLQDIKKIENKIAELNPLKKNLILPKIILSKNKEFTIEELFTKIRVELRNISKLIEEEGEEYTVKVTNLNYNVDELLRDIKKLKNRILKLNSLNWPLTLPKIIVWENMEGVLRNGKEIDEKEILRLKKEYQLEFTIPNLQHWIDTMLCEFVTPYNNAYEFDDQGTMHIYNI